MQYQEESISQIYPIVPQKQGLMRPDLLVFILFATRSWELCTNASREGILSYQHESGTRAGVFLSQCLSWNCSPGLSLSTSAAAILEYH